MRRNSSTVYYLLYISVGIIYPAYCSLVALQTMSKEDDTQWLIYWIVFHIFTLLEIVPDFFLSWIFLYEPMKLFFLMWCVYPASLNGSALIYKIFVQPFFTLYGEHIGNCFTHVTGLMGDYLPEPRL